MAGRRRGYHNVPDVFAAGGSQNGGTRASCRAPRPDEGREKPPPERHEDPHDRVRRALAGLADAENIPGHRLLAKVPRSRGFPSTPAATRMTDTPRILFLMSDTGGGHRAAANAITVALRDVAPGAAVEMKDVLVEAGRWPVNRSPQIYAWGMTHARWVWGASFHLTNGPLRARWMGEWNYLPMRRRLIGLIRDAKPDVVVSVHPLLTRSIAHALEAGDIRVPFVIVVTDLVTGHATWYEPAATRICVPTPEARQAAIRCHVDPDRVLVTGQPLHPRAAAAVGDREPLRTRFGWTQPVVLLVGGGDGVGNLGARVRALASHRIDARLVVVCGRNERLRSELAAVAWPIPVDVMGFVQNLPELMAAADVLVTKGGPGSVMEGCLAGLPILIYDYLPGQEVGNVELIRSNDAGAFVPRVEDLVAQVRHLIAAPDRRAAMGARARSLAIPDSAYRIAREVMAQVRPAPTTTSDPGRDRTAPTP